MKAITVASQKGGVGKTTLAAHVAWAAADEGMRVLAIDLDTQGNLSQTLLPGFAIQDQRIGSEQLFADAHLSAVRTAECQGQLSVLPATVHLDALDRAVDLHSATRISPRLATLPFDLIVTDTPPAIGLRHLAPMFYADKVLIPANLDLFSVHALRATILSAVQIQRMRPQMSWSIVPNSLLSTSATQLALLTKFQEFFPPAAILPPLHHRQAIRNAIAEGVPVWRHKAAPQVLRATWRDYFRNYILAVAPIEEIAA